MATRRPKVATAVVHEVPIDLRKALTSDPVALAKWNDLTPLARNEWICWTTSVKKPETRAHHVERTRSELKEGSAAPAAGPAARIGRNPARIAGSRKPFRSAAPRLRARPWGWASASSGAEPMPMRCRPWTTIDRE